MKKLFFLILCVYLLNPVIAAGATFDTFKGKFLSYDEMTSAPKAVLFLWTTRCPYCIKELIVLNDAPNLYAGVDFYFINLTEKKSTVERTVNALKLKDTITERIVLDPEAIFAEKFSIIGVPAFIFFKNGKVIHRSYYLDDEVLKEVFKDD